MSGRSKAISRRRATWLVVAALAATRCGSSGASGSPTGAAPSSLAAATVQIAANPNPVPFSGAPITDAAECANYAFTWFYDTVLQETGGSEVTFTSRVDTFDNKVANNLQGLHIVLGPHSSLTLHTRWCSGSSDAHTAQSSFTGVDASGNAVSANGPPVQLMARGR